MGITASAYIERKEGGKWVLANGGRPVSTSLRYIFPDYNEVFTKIGADAVSEELRGKYLAPDGKSVYATFYQTTVGELDSMVDRALGEVWTEINTIVRALGVPITHTRNGEEDDSLMERDADEDGLKTELSVPVVKDLIITLQNDFDAVRNIGQKEGLLLAVNDAMEDFDCEQRVVVVVG